MKKFSLLLQSSLSIASLLLAVSQTIASTARADEPVSAPNVVAPAQPANQQSATGTGTTLTTNGGSAANTTQPQSPGLMGMALPFVIMLGIMYFLMIRPQQKRMKDHQSLLTSLKTGDEVVTSAGIIGTISGMSEKVVTLEVSKNVQLKILKSQVNQVVKGPIQDLQTNA